MDLLNILNKLEYLGVDCQPIRDIISLSKIDKNIVQNFNQILLTFNSILSSNSFSANSSPLSIEILLRQLKKGLDEYKIQNKVSSSSPENASPELMALLLDLKNDLTELKKNKSIINENTTTSSNISNPKKDEHVTYSDSSSNVSTKPILGQVFINPVDEDKFKNLKGTVSIDEKSGNNINSKLEKLKQLKKEIK